MTDTLIRYNFESRQPKSLKMIQTNFGRNWPRGFRGEDF